MTHWTEKYIGLPYSKDFDCAVFVMEVLRNELGFYITLPDERIWRGKDAETIVDFGKKMAEKADIRGEYDGVVMRIRGQKRILGSHIGLYTEINGGSVIHNIASIGVILTKLNMLSMIHLELEGCYRWKIQ